MSRAIRFVQNYPCLSNVATMSVYQHVNIIQRFLLPLIARDFGYCSGPHFNLKYYESTDRVVVDPGSYLAIKVCPHLRYVVQILRIEFPEEPGFNHVNMILIDHQKQEIELFEPNGITVSWYLPIIYALENYADDYRLIPFQTKCPRLLGPQMVSRTLNCATYSMFYAFARFYDPNLPREVLVDELSSMTPDELNFLTNQFLCFEYEYAVRHSLFDLLDLRVKAISVYLDKRSNSIAWDLYGRINTAIDNVDLNRARQFLQELENLPQI